MKFGFKQYLCDHEALRDNCCFPTKIGDSSSSFYPLNHYYLRTLFSAAICRKPDTRQ